MRREKEGRDRIRGLEREIEELQARLQEETSLLAKVTTECEQSNQRLSDVQIRAETAEQERDSVQSELALLRKQVASLKHNEENNERIIAELKLEAEKLRIRAPKMEGEKMERLQDRKTDLASMESFFRHNTSPRWSGQQALEEDQGGSKADLRGNRERARTDLPTVARPLVAPDFSNVVRQKEGKIGTVETKDKQRRVDADEELSRAKKVKIDKPALETQRKPAQQDKEKQLTHRSGYPIPRSLSDKDKKRREMEQEIVDRLKNKYQDKLSLVGLDNEAIMTLLPDPRHNFSPSHL